jgi:transcriptional regulator with XRE-family HTH domain
MSHFGTTLRALIESNNLTNDDVAKKVGIDPSIISRWANASRINPSLENLIKVASVVGKSKREQAEIIAAHLRDRCHGPGSELIRISIDGRQPKTLMPENDIEYLMSASASDPLLRDLLSKMAEMHRRV